MKYRHLLTNEQLAEVVNCPENVGVTLRTINQSKGKRRMEDWLESLLNRPELGVDLKHTLSSLKKADEGIEKIVSSLTN
jgi:isocitrate dehydrogenase